MSGNPRVVDGHNDALPRIKRDGLARFLDGSDDAHVDLPKARSGGLAGGFFSVFVGGPRPPELDELRRPGRYDLPMAAPLEYADAVRETNELVDVLARLEAEADGALRTVHTIGEVETCLADGTLAAILHLEGAEPIDPGLEALDSFYERGVRSIGIVWSRRNAFGGGVPFRFPSSPDTGAGLTGPGKDLVRACNRLGILVDVSHLNERGFWDVAELTSAPIVATHSNAHALCPSSRNLTDAQLDAVAESGGVVGACFNVAMLRDDGAPDADTPLLSIVRQVEYLAERMGVEHVAFGSDFDGAEVPDELGGADRLPRLLDALRARGFAAADLERIASGNWLRVLRATWRG